LDKAPLKIVFKKGKPWVN